MVFGADGQPVRPESKRGRGKGKSANSGNGSVNATGIAAGNGTPTTGVSDVNTGLYRPAKIPSSPHFIHGN
ncbi:hypothetical protein M5D96_007622 [Drosophila gunungcola]|uniref:Uncharacterized protein n=1 Tax=Drosophila gunungcola TaxID=103775 RepID=A0A9P9YL15_9MUSC|nr:hypothetical protein M5D96_007622 [Drosophila gunungcola]